MPTEAFRRLRLLGLFGIAVIAGVAAIQIVVMFVALMHAPNQVRWAGLSFGIASFAAVVLMYALVMRPNERTWQRLVEQERMQSNRLTAVTEIKSRRAGRSKDQIVGILELAAQSFEMEEGAVSFVEGDALRVAFSISDRIPVGLKIPIVQTFARHVYGSYEVVGIADTNTLDWKDDAAVTRQGWRSYIGATIFAEAQPIAMVSFTSRTPRTRPFDDFDNSFIRISASLIAASLDRLRTESELSRMAHFDSITGLPNRAYFEEHVTRMMSQAKRNNSVLNLLFIDLDGFKGVNDELGHAAGDEVLRIIAARLRALVRAEDVLARLGGDEFIIAQSATDAESALALGRRIVESARHSFLVSGHVARVGASVGTATYPRDAADLDTLMARADSAMYEAKNNGKGSAVSYGS